MSNIDTIDKTYWTTVPRTGNNVELLPSLKISESKLQYKFLHKEKFVVHLQDTVVFSGLYIVVPITLVTEPSTAPTVFAKARFTGKSIHRPVSRKLLASKTKIRQTVPFWYKQLKRDPK